MKNEISSIENLIKIIEDSRNNALRRVNEEPIRMYWNVGEYLSKESARAITHEDNSRLALDIYSINLLMVSG